MDVNLDSHILSQFELKNATIPRCSYLVSNDITYIDRKKSFNGEYYCNLHGLGSTLFQDIKGVQLGDFWHLVNKKDFIWITDGDDNNEIICLINRQNVVAIMDNTVLFKDDTYIRFSSFDFEKMLEIVNKMKK